MDTDTAIYAIIAVLLLAKLWSVFGRRNNSDQDTSARPNPFIRSGKPVDDDEPQLQTSPSGVVSAVEPPILLRPRAAPTSLAGGLERVKAIDPQFDERQFLASVRTAFSLIVDDFAKGDLTRSKCLLGETVLPHFEAAIATRQKAGQVMSCQILRIRDAEITSVKIEEPKAFLTVRFVSEQKNTLRSAAGDILSGVEGRVEEITDIWIFARDLKSTNPNWILSETRS